MCYCIFVVNIIFTGFFSNLGEIFDIVGISSSFSVKSFANSRPGQLTTLSIDLTTQYNILAVLRLK